MQRDLSGIREQYRSHGLDVGDLDPDPLALFDRWFAEWVATEPYDATAVTLATADARGRPSARFVLLKEYGPDGFTFFTNAHSRKGRDLEANPWAALVFPWFPMSRQVRVSGPVEPVPPDEADSYFASRPRGSQEGAWASDQSEPVADRTALEGRFAAVEERFAGAVVPRPSHWGGFRVVAEEIEFWQGRPDRMHDRFAYRRRSPRAAWKVERLQP